MSLVRTYLLGLLLIPTFIMAGGEEKTKKTLSAMSLQVADAPKIDGVLDEAIWMNAEIATEFVQQEPNPGSAPGQRTEVRVLYDDEAIYIGAMLYDSAPDSILRQLTQRDEFGNADLFGITLDCYKDGINGVEFLVTGSGVQIDTKFGQNSNDRNWNAVWWSNIGFTDEGWVVEMKIPYAALRFPDVPEQEWHMNFVRIIRRTREKSFWNEVNPQVEGFFNQNGLLQGINNVESPLRLFFFPYVSAYMENDESGGEGWQSAFNGGMDLKYGINDAFTLDMTLIPDFGQVQSDNQVLNLGHSKSFSTSNVSSLPKEPSSSIRPIYSTLEG